MKNINSIDELDEFILENNKNVIMLYFGAEWCGPCKKLKNKLDTPELEKIIYCHIDADSESTTKICRIYNVKVLPTLIFIKLKEDTVKILDRLDGYDYTKLLFIYDKLYNVKIEN